MKTTKIYGPPGTGKTTYLIETLKKLLASGLYPTQVAYLSHTNAAAEEVKSRLHALNASWNVSKDFPWFRTIHSACCRLTGINASEICTTATLKDFGQKYGYRFRNPD